MIFNVHVSALATMVGSVAIEADSPQKAVELAKMFLRDDGRVDWEFVDGGRPAPGSSAVDAVWDEEDGEEIAAETDTPAELARDALASLVAARNMLKRAGCSPRMLNRVREAISSAKGAVRHADHRTQKLV